MVRYWCQMQKKPIESFFSLPVVTEATSAGGGGALDENTDADTDELYSKNKEHNEEDPNLAHLSFGYISKV